MNRFVIRNMAGDDIGKSPYAGIRDARSDASYYSGYYGRNAKLTVYQTMRDCGPCFIRRGVYFAHEYVSGSDTERRRQ